jgi:hypothetical protein
VPRIRVSRTKGIGTELTQEGSKPSTWTSDTSRPPRARRGAAQGLAALDAEQLFEGRGLVPAARLQYAQLAQPDPYDARSTCPTVQPPACRRSTAAQVIRDLTTFVLGLVDSRFRRVPPQARRRRPRSAKAGGSSRVQPPGLHRCLTCPSGTPALRGTAEKLRDQFLPPVVGTGFRRGGSGWRSSSDRRSAATVNAQVRAHLKMPPL